MSKRMFPLHLTCALVLAISSVSPMAAAAVSTESAAEQTTAQEAAPVQEPDEGSLQDAPEADAVSEKAGESGSDSGVKEETARTETEAVPTDAAGNMISQETADAIENADLGADQIAEQPDEQQAAADVADAAQDTIADPQETTDPAMDKSSIGAVFDDTYSFTKEQDAVYLLTSAAVKSEPNDEAEDLAILDKYEEILLTGSNDHQYWEVQYKGEIAYIDSTVITREYSEIEALREEDERRLETEAQSKAEQEVQIAQETEESRFEWVTALAESRRAALASQTRNPNWNGAVLSRSKGSVYGPTGKETYYNLNMSGCVRNMNRRGYYGEVWVRNDGVKMFGDYIMCAANLGLHPYGSLVECSLGTCIVVDTGGFASGNPNQLDIAVTW